MSSRESISAEDAKFYLFFSHVFLQVLHVLRKCYDYL